MFIRFIVTFTILEAWYKNPETFELKCHKNIYIKNFIHITVFNKIISKFFGYFQFFMTYSKLGYLNRAGNNNQYILSKTKISYIV